MTTKGLADQYLSVPNDILQSLGGASWLRDEIHATQFTFLTSWPSFPKMLPFGVSFHFRVKDREYEVKIVTSCVDRSKYQISIHRMRFHVCLVAEDRLTLDQAVVKFFEFTKIEPPG